MHFATSKLVAILLSVAFATLATSASQPNFSDCMKNPFATGCRGISAKRSQQQLESSLFAPAQDGATASELASNWLESVRLRGGQSKTLPIMEVTRIFAPNDDLIRRYIRAGQPGAGGERMPAD